MSGRCNVFVGDKVRATESPGRWAQGYLIPWESPLQLHWETLWSPGLLWVELGDTKWIQRILVPQKRVQQVFVGFDQVPFGGGVQWVLGLLGSIK